MGYSEEDFKKNQLIADGSDKHFKRIQKQFSSYRQNRYYLEQLWITNFLSTFTHEKYVLKEDGTIAKILYTTDEKKKTYLKINKLFAIYRTAYAKFWNAMPLIYVNPEDTDAESEFGAELAESIIKKELVEWKKSGLFSQSFMWYIITGNAFTETKYNKDLGELAGYDEAGRKITEGKICINSLSPLSVYFDPIRYSIEQSMDAIKSLIIHKDVYAKLFNDKEPPSSIDNSLKNRILLTGDYYYLDKTINYDDYIEIGIYHMPPNILLEKGELTLFTGNKILSTETYPFDEMPFSQAKRVETGFGYGETTTSYAVPVERELALFRGQMAEHAEKLSNPMLQLPLGSRITAEKIGNRYVKVVKINPKLGDAKFIQAAEFPQYFHETIRKFEEDIEDISSIHNASQGKRESGERSGLQQAYKIDQDDSQHIPDVSNFYKMFESAGKKLLKLVEKAYTTERYLKVFGKNNIKYVKYVGKQLKGNNNLSIEVVAGLPINRVQRQQLLMQYAAMGILQKSDMLHYSELGEMNSAYRRDMKDQLRQQEEITQIVDGKFVKYDETAPTIEVGAEENHLVHIKEVIAFTKTGKYQELSDKTKARLWQHVKAHEVKLVQTFKEDPIVANITMGLGTADESDINAIMMEIQRATAAEGGVSGAPAPGSAETGGVPVDVMNRAKTVGSQGPQAEALPKL